ncbi:ergothioneine biosynthesis protein EgtC [Angustibacter sp. McL0619]|uniref:ergothioneine biosynthesis protein EgtC n=1 Tax=Angustibacter sp. McL0619 TaxID=3415676 RepID=UPI003CED7854
MCRHLGWLGAPRTLHELVLAGPHSLLVQSYRPRRQRFGLVNADGWGVGFSGPDGEPARWRSTRPLWQDASFASVATALRSGLVVAAVRSATEGMPIDESATAPFLHDGWLVSHNGRVERSVLPVRPDAESLCDSALLAAHVVAEGVDRIADTLLKVAADDPGARLNLLLARPGRLIATTYGDTLSRICTDAGTLLASEPLDDDERWTDVPDRHVVEVTPAGLTVTPLESP